MNMSKKYIISLALCAIALVGVLFLPWISIDILGQKMEASLSDIMDLLDMAGVDVVGDLGGILIIMGIAGGIVGIIGSLMKKKAMIMAGSIAGAAGILIFILAVNAVVQEYIGGYMEFGLTDWVGFGIWLCLIGYIAAAVVTAVMKEDV